VTDERMLIPSAFCWTRFGTEAGETVEEILARKEKERLATGGTFYWGIGNAIGPGVTELLRRTAAPEVLFSPVAGPPRRTDVVPPAVVSWLAAEGLDGIRRPIPSGILITSGIGRRLRPRYALVCSREEPIALTDAGEVRTGELSNLLSGRPVGASQVTAVVRRLCDQSPVGRPYPIRLRAYLAPPYVVRLGDPRIVAGQGLGDYPHPLERPTGGGQLRLPEGV